MARLLWRLAPTQEGCMRKQTNREHRTVAGPSFQFGGRSMESVSMAHGSKGVGVVAEFRDGSNCRLDRGSAGGAGESLLKFLKAENAELKKSVIQLALEIKDLREGR
jgi:hypothetical protein